MQPCLATLDSAKVDAMRGRTWMKATYPNAQTSYWYAVEGDAIVGYKVAGDDRFFELRKRPRADDTLSRLVRQDRVTIEGPFDAPE